MRGYASFHGGHSRFGDGSGEPAEIARAVVERGLVAFGFTEHFDVPPQLTRGEWLEGRVAGAWRDEYLSAVRTAEGPVLAGFEVEYVRGALDWTKAELAHHDTDYLVGSVHFVRVDREDISVDSRREAVAEALRRTGSGEALQLLYYDHVLELIGWNLVNVIGHLDVVKLHLRPDEAQVTPAIEVKVDGVLEAMRDAGVAMDVNARGYIKACARQYPDAWVMRRARAIGVQVTLGDDSHRAEDVGLNLDRAAGELRAAGYEHMALVRPGGVLEEVALP